MKKKKTRSGASIEFLENGPIVVSNLSRLENEAGERLETRPKTALCRCGRSKTKPFCDGRHKDVGFSDARTGDGSLDKRDTYAGKKITIFDNRGICSHAGFCTDGLPSVWRMKTEPWIDPDGAEVKAIIETIGKCPSGALSYAIGGVEHRGRDREPAIRLSPDGPYLVTGGVSIHGVGQGEGASTEHFTLCRCGASKNKPFCDGSHWYVHFKGDNSVKIAELGGLEEHTPVHARVGDVDLVVVREGDEIHVLEGKCRHQGALLSDGTVSEGGLVCGLHGWTYDLRNGENRDGGGLDLKRFRAWMERDAVFVDGDEIDAWHRDEPAADAARGDAAAGIGGAGGREEPHNAYIHELAAHGLARTGPHGPAAAMGVPRYELPSWDDIQFVTAQLHRLPQLDGAPVGTKLVLGPKSKRPLEFEIPIIVSDMSFGALSEEAKIALARGAERAGTGICSGEGGMLPEEQAENRRYLYELASARFGFSWDKIARVQAFHFKGGQAAKTGTGGHLPGEKVTEKIAGVRGLQAGVAAVSPARFPDWDTLDAYREFADEVRKRTGGIPIGFKLSAQHVEEDIEAAIRVGVDYLILDGRGGGTGAAPLIFRDHISVPTLAALPRARRYLDRTGHGGITLLITGGLRTPADFAKALALGADGIAIANSAIQAIGCLGTRACHTNNCPVGIATQKKNLRARLDVDEAADRLCRFLGASVQLMSLLARACGHTDLAQLSLDDLTTWKRDVADLAGVRYGGVAAGSDAAPRGA